jgi:hypothetical protein
LPAHDASASGVRLRLQHARPPQLIPQSRREALGLQAPEAGGTRTSGQRQIGPGRRLRRCSDLGDLSELTASSEDPVWPLGESGGSVCSGPGKARSIPSGPSASEAQRERATRCSMVQGGVRLGLGFGQSSRHLPVSRAVHVGYAKGPNCELLGPVHFRQATQGI